TIVIDEPELKDLVQRFVVKLPQYIENILECDEDKRWDDLRQHIHDMKGTSGNYGYNELYKLMQNIEFELTKENYDGVHTMISRIEGIYERIQAGL
ncbi:MAG: Hpt domain-containing protein, partial [Gammaproteobacteria bacterium]|nr:Hpt domain-containing protein [Gammaproteobacteria bacterium]